LERIDAHGLIPSWWKKTAKDVPSTFNARAESVADKPMFRSAFKRNRCIIPASGYFERKTMPDRKQPYFISAADGGVLSIAALSDRWHSTDTGETVLSCTTIITDANAFTRGRWVDWAADAASSFASCGHAATHTLSGNAPL